MKYYILFFWGIIGGFSLGYSIGTYVVTKREFTNSKKLSDDIDALAKTKKNLKADKFCLVWAADEILSVTGSFTVHVVKIVPCAEMKNEYQ